MHRPVSELRRTMTRREFYAWIAFARIYPIVEHEAPDFGANQTLTPEIIARVKARRRE